MSRDRLDRFVRALERGLDDIACEPGINAATPYDLIKRVHAAVQFAHDSINTGPEGTRILVGPGHTRHGRYGTVVATTPGPPACCEVMLDGFAATVLVPQSMCLPVATPVQPPHRQETVTELYARMRAQDAADIGDVS